MTYIYRDDFAHFVMRVFFILMTGWEINKRLKQIVNKHKRAYGNIASAGYKEIRQMAESSL